jgi:hypothetical protein
MEESQFFPFLTLENAESEEELTTNWMFLHTYLDVGKDDDVQFLLGVAYSISRAHPEGLPERQCQRFLDLYVSIDAKRQAAADPQSSGELIRLVGSLGFFQLLMVLELMCDPRARFQDLLHVYIPAYYREDAFWAPIEDCLWDGPDFMMSKYPLEYLYGSVLGTPPDQMKRLRRFFQQTLSVRGASWKDMTSELESLKAGNQYDFDLDDVSSIYEYLNKMETVASWEDLRCVSDLSNSYIRCPHVHTAIAKSSKTRLLSSLSETVRLHGTRHPSACGRARQKSGARLP